MPPSGDGNPNERAASQRQKLLVFVTGQSKGRRMRLWKKSGLLLLTVSLLVRPGQLSLLAAEPAPKPKPQLYDTAADGKQQIAQALNTARAENKRLILKFG